jgi:cytochrome c553
MYLCVARSGEMKIMPFIPEMLEKSENYKFFELKEVKKGENNE